MKYFKLETLFKMEIIVVTALHRFLPHRRDRSFLGVILKIGGVSLRHLWRKPEGHWYKHVLHTGNEMESMTREKEYKM